MNRPSHTGRNGEDLAREYLEALGYSVLARNWRWGRAELDLVAMDGPMLVFAEVKTRSGSTFGQPWDFVDRRQRSRIYGAAAGFLRESGYAGEARFDVLAVFLHDSGEPRIEHIRDAYYGH